MVLVRGGDRSVVFPCPVRGLADAECGDGVCVLLIVRGSVQCGVGVPADQSHESGSCPQLLQKKKSTLYSTQDTLNNRRNTFAFTANLLVLTLGLILFATMNNKQTEYQLISILVVAIGLCTSLFFLYHIKENRLVAECRQKKERLKLKLSTHRNQKQIALTINENVLS